MEKLRIDLDSSISGKDLDRLFSKGFSHEAVQSFLLLRISNQLAEIIKQQSDIFNVVDGESDKAKRDG
jgi:hypothetical protein